MSGLWTPSGEHVPSEPADRADEPVGTRGAERETIADATVEEELRRVRAEIASTPAVDIVANHAIGLWQLAVLHLYPEEDRTPRLAEAALAIDAMGGIVDALGDRLGDHAAPLRDALTQLRLAFVAAQRPDRPV